MYLRLLQKLIARDEREKHHVAALHRHASGSWHGRAHLALLAAGPTLLLLQVISRPQELLILLCFAVLVLNGPWRFPSPAAETFAFTLAPPRRLLWQVRLAHSILPILALSLIGSLVFSFDLVAKFWGLFLDGPWVQLRASVPHKAVTPTAIHCIPLLLIPSLLCASLQLTQELTQSPWRRLLPWFCGLIGFFLTGNFYQLPSLIQGNLYLDLSDYMGMSVLVFILSLPIIGVSLLFLRISYDHKELNWSWPRLRLPSLVIKLVGAGITLVSLVSLLQMHAMTAELWQERLQLSPVDGMLWDPPVQNSIQSGDKLLVQCIVEDENRKRICAVVQKTFDVNIESRQTLELFRNSRFKSGVELIVHDANSCRFALWEDRIDAPPHQDVFRPISDPWYIINNGYLPINHGRSPGSYDPQYRCVDQKNLTPKSYRRSLLPIDDRLTLWIRCISIDPAITPPSVTASTLLKELRAAETERRRHPDYWTSCGIGVPWGHQEISQRHLLPCWQKGIEFRDSFILNTGEMMILAFLLGLGLMLGPRRSLWALPLASLLIVITLASLEAKLGLQWRARGIPVMNHFLASPAKDGGVR